MAVDKANTPALEEGTRIGNRFRILRSLGKGGLGTVYLAEDRSLRRKVALKFRAVSKSASDDTLERHRDRLRRGVQTAQKISHPRVCRIYDFHDIDGYEFVAMELVKGPSLSEVIRDAAGPLDPSLISAVALDLCDGLQAIHEQGFVHQDIKPSNLLFDDEGRIKITDFDIVGSRWRGLTMQYAAPEQLRAVSDPDRSEHEAPTAAGDVFSVGCVLYEAATQHRAFPGGSLGAHEPRDPTFYAPDLPQRLIRAIGACLQRDPDARPQSARELRRILEADPEGERPPLEPGTVLGGRFAIGKRLGEGNSGVVFRARDRGLGEDVALKFWNPDQLVTDPTPKMVEEVRKAQQLPRHPRLCQIVGFHQVDSYAFAAMELVEGEDLAHRIAREGRLDAESVVSVGLDLCDGLHALHKADLVHQDIEPGNILLDADGRVKIADLGFAGRKRWWGRTLPYASPEQLMALEGLRASTPTPASDLFAVGCVLYEMLTGRQAFPEGCLVDFGPVSPARLYPDVPEHLDRAVLACLQRNPKRRPTAGELTDMLLDRYGPGSRTLTGDETDPFGVGPGSLARMSRRLFKILAHDPLVLLLLQDHHDLLRALSLILHQVKDDRGDFDRVHHVILPTSRHIDLDTFFSRLGPQCELDEPVADAAAWEEAIHDRLSRGEKMLLIISGWARGLEEGRRELGRFLDSLTRQFGSLRAVLIGGEDLAELKFHADTPLLRSAEHLFWPEFDLKDVSRMAATDFPDLKLPKDHAQELLDLTGGHYRLLRACLRAIDNGSEVDERVISDTIWSLFTPYRENPETRESVLRRLEHKVVAAYDPWPSDPVLRRLFWSGALVDRDNQFQWRAPVFQKIGKRVLS